MHVNFGGSVALDSPQVSGGCLYSEYTSWWNSSRVAGVFGSARENIGYAVTVYNSGGGNKYYLDGVTYAF